MSKTIPGVIMVLSVPIGMGVGSYMGHLTLGGAIGGCVGFVVGLSVLLMMRSRFRS
jgi:hypothetical protein